MKKTHKLWPVSYIDDEGEQVNTLYNFDPSIANSGYWAGESFTVTKSHPEMGDDAKLTKIAELRAQIARLESE